jgi:hypothetical protein
MNNWTIWHYLGLGLVGWIIYDVLTEDEEYFPELADKEQPPPVIDGNTLTVDLYDEYTGVYLVSTPEGDEIAWISELSDGSYEIYVFIPGVGSKYRTVKSKSEFLPATKAMLKIMGVL